jgi:D-glucosaminate-6-phosphate ammonia-lyase
MTVYARFSVPTVINAAGTVTRLSGGHIHPEVLAAMRDASGECVDMLALQAGASRVIARVTGAEAGIVTSGASAALLLGAAACLAGLDSARMNRLPDVADGRNEFIVVRSQRNMYDRAVTVAGGRIIEVGIPDRYSGPGVRDAAPWEVDAAITPRTAAICYLAQPQSRPSLAEVASVAHAHAIPVLVDAAAQLPPQDNLRRFLAEGADLVAFSGGKAIGGPQSSGILAGRGDLIASALMQMLDLDLFADTWNPPDEFARLRQLRGLPQHGIGRSCKVGKEEIVGLLVALERFAATDDTTRQSKWHDILQAVVAAADGTSLHLTILDRAMPLLEIRAPNATALAARLAAHDPPIHCSLGRRDDNLLVISPAALTAAQATIIGTALRAI